MADLLFTFHCARGDAESLALALRGLADAPVHWQDEVVLGHDYADAGTGEQVEGLLRRTALTLIVPESRATALVDTARDARCRAPVRWHAVPVHSQGRIA
ncbi:MULTISPECIES: DUF3240 family protein [unclassified Novosphingobium]|uniref:DUF3240 family protein n=1 Tax=unclassified Novosphingobium TaxID=2644732 RepID=UPI00146D8D56|nr:MULTISPECIES: DUF3240 family protein [unclassified Novosphingobium]NMN03177.1 hypothetical protein [Novosphingobium sp. SG919]NMN86833.1 hypothetical protein [Novosphingobium sp. SG916]